MPEIAEAPPSMKVPLYLLAVPTALGGLVVVYPEAVSAPASTCCTRTGW